MQEVWAVKISATFWLTLSASTPSDLQIWQELGEGSGALFIEKAHSKWERFDREIGSKHNDGT